ncbi:diiron oxygenase [Photobacterium sp. 1_MG-2023]|uniref:diiron oxygenase n=1 Tax=Photobacterium sp. 1_MG-2023 TaxID=3062646 RepID=UPI0026E4157B|nr:diiron oxygenase [Photobacterium sp. 1_MG-2023]MDO6708152.1 diiron oxygenase [Photobacterium sp. 1_MG-2023]
MDTNTAEFEKKINRLNTVTERLINSSEKRSMSTLNDHPWDVPVGEHPVLRKKERISIYGTDYWDKMTEAERIRLSQEEMVSWWSAFIHLESLVVEYYMKELNGGAFDDLPVIRDYMKHFIKEELVHTLVFGKALDYFGIEIYPMPEFLRSFYDDNAGTGKYPLMAVYLTMIIEWIADEYQRLDADAEYVHPMAKAVVQAHWREEMRHIKWGQQMIKSLIDTDDEFKEHAQQLTPVYVRQLIDQGVTNVDCFDRVNPADPAFDDQETLLETVLESPHRQQLNDELMKPLMHYFISSGIYNPMYHDIWVMQGFGHLLDTLNHKDS